MSGAAASSLGEAAAAGLDAFLTGEPAEHTMLEAREAGIHFIAGSHYGTETFGVRRLGELLADRFGVRHEFVDFPNPYLQRLRSSSNRQPAEERTSMANHLTPTELSRETGLDREEVIAKCVELGVPIFQGKIDKRLFAETVKYDERTSEQPQVWARA